MIEIVCSGVLFDMDGVLVDSTPAVERAWAAWAATRGLDPTEIVKRAHGRPSISTIRELLPHADHSAEDRVVERLEIEDIDGVIALPGAKELLAALPQQKIAVVTSATRPLAGVRLRAAGIPIPPALVTASDCKHGKPDPEPYLKGAASVAAPPSDCIVIEDAPAGIRAGKSAGARVIALQTTASNDELLAAGADWIAKDCSAIRVASLNGAAPIRLLVDSLRS